MAKVRMTDLSDLLGAKKAAATASTPEPDTAPETTTTVPENTTPAASENPQPTAKKTTAARATSTKTSTRAASRGSGKPKTQSSSPAPTPEAGRPRYLTLMRKEARITPTQADELSRLVRLLNRARFGQGERITDNTLIRVAIGLLLERVDELHGTTEAELFQSLGLEPAE